MIVDPVQAFVKTSTLLAPTTTSTPPVAPVPTVIPDRPEYELIRHAGEKALWYDSSSSDLATMASANRFHLYRVGFVVFLITFLVFAGLSWKVPVVCGKHLDQVNGKALMDLDFPRLNVSTTRSILLLLSFPPSLTLLWQLDKATTFIVL